jgi:cytidine deaminase
VFDREKPMHQDLIERAQAVRGEFSLAKPDWTAGAVGCALITRRGNLYTGICLEVACGIGFCAEHGAIAEMLKARETVIDRLVAVGARGILMPCGRCRELMVQVSRENVQTQVVVDAQIALPLGELLPHRWF